MIRNRISLVCILTLLVQQMAFAQQASGDFMRSIGRIYVVVAVILIIFFGIVLFLIYLDRKLTKLENQIKENE
ncbi:MAG TPA: CcmD family protein [Haliscomenobacter sp.]|uniref:CcmD family protein n=1 Tax=Haliscomenobacter sp. TaxID=2717303 RepID=UPI002BF2AD02|nr:CcmD family protein [Haliscomenobacter sp.]HOY15940.1 CcmD family protein [Haliscomenobacter sp.]